MKELSAFELAKVSRSLAHLESDYLTRTANRQPMNESVFEDLLAGVTTVVEHFHPSGSNDKLADMSSALGVFFKSKNMAPEDYWSEVWRRNGRKSLAFYNDKKNPSPL